MKYLSSKVLILPFSNGQAVNDELSIVNTYLSALSLISGESGGELTEKLGTFSLTSEKNASTPSVLEDSSSSIKGAVNMNDSVTLTSLLQLNEKISQHELLSALSRAISSLSLACIPILLQRIEDLDDVLDLNGRNIFHRFVIGHGRKTTQDLASSPSAASRNLFINPAEVPVASTGLSKAFGSDGANSCDEIDVLTLLLDHLNKIQRKSLVSKDQYNRTPLHYSTQYGLKAVTQVILDYMKKWGLFLDSDGLQAPYWLDMEGVSPLSLTVSGKHPKTLQVIISSIEGDLKSGGELLILAAKYDSTDILAILLEHVKDINFFHEFDYETALYTSSKLGFVKCTELLVRFGADTEIAESTYGWTPIFAACVEGNLDIVKILIEHGADVNKEDGSGWKPIEHACLRGHLDIVDLIEMSNNTPLLSFFKDESGTEGSLSTVINLPTASSIRAQIPSPPLKDSPIKTFGHRYLTDRSLILITLGSMDLRHKIAPVQLERVPFHKAHSTQLDTALSLVIKSVNCQNEPVVLDLPLTDSQVTEQIQFYAKDISNVKLYFDIVQTYNWNSNKAPLGRAVALLSSLYTSVGLFKRSLHQTVTLPILECESLEVMGTLSFSVLIVTPFSHEKMGIEKPSTYWKSLITTRVIGHRGLGKNSTSKKSLQLGENTLESFIQAANLGASYVEFDVQLTKDHVPVIYHDFLVGETGIDIPMHSLTSEQFLGMSEKREISPSRIPRREQTTVSSSRKPRSMSLFDSGDIDDYDVMNERMKFTRDFKVKGFKGNSRGLSIQSPFTTLKQAFKTLPKNVGFNIECKYPMLDESEAEDMESFAIELNLWVDTVLKCVYDLADGRDIIFSSFHPDICLMLSLKQPSIPILFLTEAGTAPMADIRASCLQEAIRFSKRWNLLGIVSECTPLIKCPRLVNVIKESGLVCVSYGTLNNTPSNARMQMASGVDAVIVDSVLAVRRGLTAESRERPGSVTSSLTSEII